MTETVCTLKSLLFIKFVLFPNANYSRTHLCFRISELLAGAMNSPAPLALFLSGSCVVSGCAFLKYETKEQALAAMDAVNGKHKMEVRSLLA